MYGDYDYIVRDSSLLPNRSSFKAVNDRDHSIRVGIVRESQDTTTGTVYTVELAVNGKMLMVSCYQMVKFGGVHNFEEYGVRKWASSPAFTTLPTASDKYETRAGDMVVVAFIAGDSREGVILGSLKHYARKQKLKRDDIAYLSEFNGLETSIKIDGSYKITFKGYSPADETILKLPPSGKKIEEPKYNPLIGGSYFGFSKNGSWIASDKSQFIKINKDVAKGSIIIKSGSCQVEIGGNPAIGAFGVKAGKAVIDAATTASIKAKTSLAIQALQVSLKGTKVAIGNDQIELFDGLVQLIDALGSLAVTSPVGTCTPLMSAPTWASKVEPLKLKLTAIKGSLKDGDSFELAGNDDPTIDGNS